MASQAWIEACMTFMVVLIAVYFIDATFGLSMSALYNTFVNLTPTLTMSAGWKGVATSVLGTWVHPLYGFWATCVVSVIITGIWLGLKAIMNVDYSRGFQ